MRVDYAVRQHEEWYKGDGALWRRAAVSPGLLQQLRDPSDAASGARWVSSISKSWDSFGPAVLARAKRYAAIEERLIGPEGAFPPLGRSLAYRCGAFHLLATMALRQELPEGLKAEQVRAALTAVLRRTMEAPGTFDKDGWLTVGLCGHQPAIAESYISTGSLYLCSTALLPLGLPRGDGFWSSAAVPWTGRRAWNGEDVAADHAM